VVTLEGDGEPEPFAGASASAKPAERRYLIGELAQELGISAQAIRYYEREGLLKPARQWNLRVFTAEEKRRLELVIKLRQLGLSVAQLQQSLEAFSALGDATNREKAARVLSEHAAATREKIKQLSCELAGTEEMIAELNSGAERE
jgi:DNA-binding transcriptional MerR regulator